MDHYQVRKYRAWYRHATLSMLAHAFLAVTARASRPGAPPPEPGPASGNDQAAPAKRGPDPRGQRFTPPRTYAPPALMRDETGRDLISLTAAEARRLFNLHTRVTRPADFAPAMVRLATPQAGRRPQIPLRPKTQRSQDALEGCLPHMREVLLGVQVG